MDPTNEQTFIIDARRFVGILISQHVNSRIIIRNILPTRSCEQAFWARPECVYARTYKK